MNMSKHDSAAISCQIAWNMSSYSHIFILQIEKGKKIFMHLGGCLWAIVFVYYVLFSCIKCIVVATEPKPFQH